MSYNVKKTSVTTLSLVPVVCIVFLGLNVVLLVLTSSSGNFPLDEGFMNVWYVFLGVYAIVTTISLIWTIKMKRTKADALGFTPLLSKSAGIMICEAAIFAIFPLGYTSFMPRVGNFWYTLEPENFTLVPIGFGTLDLLLIYSSCIVGIVLALFANRKAEAIIREKLPTSLEGWQVHALVGQFHRWTLIPPLIVLLNAALTTIMLSSGGFNIPVVWFYLIPLIIYQMWLQSIAKRNFRQVCFEMQPGAQKLAKDLERDLAGWTGIASQGSGQGTSDITQDEARFAWDGTTSHARIGKGKIPVLTLVLLIVVAFACGNLLLMVFARPAVPVPTPAQGGNSSHAPINITGDAQFTLENGVVGGIGTQEDPYIISGWKIDAGMVKKPCIIIADVTKNFIVKNCSCKGSFIPYYETIEFPYGRGLVVKDTGNFSIQDNIFSDCGIYIYSVINANITDNYASLSSSPFGIPISVDTSTDITIRKNICVGGSYGIRLWRVINGTIKENECWFPSDTGIISSTLGYGSDQSRVNVTENYVVMCLGFGMVSPKFVVDSQNGLDRVLDNVYVENDTFLCSQVLFAVSYLISLIIVFLVIRRFNKRESDPYALAELRQNSFRVVLAELLVIVSLPFDFRFGMSHVAGLIFVATPSSSSYYSNTIVLWGIDIGPLVLLVIGVISLLLTRSTTQKMKNSLLKQTPKSLDAWETNSLVIGTYRTSIVPLIIILGTAVYVQSVMMTSFPVGVIVFLAPLIIFQGWLCKRGNQQFRRACTEMQPAVRTTSQSVAGLGKSFKEWMHDSGQRESSNLNSPPCEFCGVQFSNAGGLRSHLESTHPDTKLKVLNPLHGIILSFIGVVILHALIRDIISSQLLPLLAIPYIAGILVSFTWAARFTAKRNGSLSLKQIQGKVPGIIIAEYVLYLVLPIFSQYPGYTYYKEIIYLSQIYYSYYIAFSIVAVVFGAIAVTLDLVFSRNARRLLGSGFPKTLDAWGTERLIGSVYRRGLLPIFITIGFEVYIIYFNFSSFPLSIAFLIPLWLYHRWLCVQEKQVYRRACFAMHPSAQTDAIKDFMADMDREVASWGEGGKKKQEFPGEVPVTVIEPALPQNQFACKLCWKVLPSATDLWQHLMTKHKSLLREHKSSRSPPSQV